MTRSIIASVALATALVIGCAKTEEVPAEIPANTTPTVNADSIAKLKADSMLSASQDSLRRVDSQLQANNAKKTPPKKATPVVKTPTPAPPMNPDGTTNPAPIRKSR